MFAAFVRVVSLVALGLVLTACSSTGGPYDVPSDQSSAARRQDDALVVAATAKPASTTARAPVRASTSASATATAAAAATTQPTTNPTDDNVSHFTLAFPTGDRATSTILVEQLGESQIRLNHPYQYKLTITNLTDAWLSDVDVRQRAPKYFRVDSSDPPPHADGDGHPHWALGEFGPHESKSVTVTAIPDRLGNVASSLSVSFVPTLGTKSQVINPELKLAKQGPSQVDLCEPLIYRYTIRNVGVGPARKVRIEDPLPEGLRTENGARAVTLDVGTLGEGETRDFRVNLKAQRNGEFVTQASARGDQGLTAETSPMTTAVRAPLLAVALKLPQREFIDKPVLAQITVTNRGDAPARSSLLRLDASSAGRLFMPPATRPSEPILAGAGSSSSDTADHRALGTIEPGGSRTCWVTLRGTQGGDTRLTATATAICSPTATDAASIYILTLPALLLECTDSIDPVPIGDTTTYTITVKNQGSGPDKNVRIVATLPQEMTLLKTTGATPLVASPATTNPDDRKLTFAPVPVLAPGETLTWKVEVRAEKIADVRFRVELTSDWLIRPAVKEEPTRLY
jgi:uncharacterized repeat protein (TIGR01451 family)